MELDISLPKKITKSIKIASQKPIAIVVPEISINLKNPYFHYSIPEKLSNDIVFGTHVRVLFRGKRINAIVVNMIEETDFKVLPILNIVSTIPVMTPEQLNFFELVAKTYTCSVNIILNLGIPDNIASVNKKFLNSKKSLIKEEKNDVAQKNIHLPIKKLKGSVVVGEIEEIENKCLNALSDDKSVLIICSSDDECMKLSKTLQIFSNFIVHYKGNKRYEEYLNLMYDDKPKIIIGTRSAVFVSKKNIGLNIIIEDLDYAHNEDRKPYFNSREILMLKTYCDNSKIIIQSATKSIEAQNCINKKILKNRNNSKKLKNNVSFLIPDFKKELIPSEAYQNIKNSLGNVLVQVPFLGNAKYLSCKHCSSRAICKKCSGNLYSNEKNELICKTCNKTTKQFACPKCGGATLNYFNIGITKVATQLKKSFPEFNIVESSSKNPVLNSSFSKKTIVISTPNSFPNIKYNIGIITNADAQIAMPSNNSLQNTLNNWQKIRLLVKDNLYIVGNVPKNIKNKFTEANFDSLINDELDLRNELNLFPMANYLKISVKNELKAQNNLYGPSVKNNDITYIYKNKNYLELMKFINDNRKNIISYKVKPAIT